MMAELLAKPKPGDILMSDPGTRLAYSREVARLVDRVVGNVERPDSTLERRTEAVMLRIQSSTEMASHFPAFRTRLDSPPERSVLLGAVMMGLALGMAEEEAGWRKSPVIQRSGGPIRRWWEDKRPRWADQRTLEALVDIQRGAVEDSMLAGYLVLAGFWHSFDEWD
jgi:hypothetical protein